MSSVAFFKIKKGRISISNGSPLKKVDSIIIPKNKIKKSTDF